jgi:hypothetical protein
MQGMRSRSEGEQQPPGTEGSNAMRGDGEGSASLASPWAAAVDQVYRIVDADNVYGLADLVEALPAEAGTGFESGWELDFPGFFFSLARVYPAIPFMLPSNLHLIPPLHSDAPILSACFQLVNSSPFPTTRPPFPALPPFVFPTPLLCVRARACVLLCVLTPARMSVCVCGVGGGESVAPFLFSRTDSM